MEPTSVAKENNEEHHPNLHAVGLLVDISNAIRDRVRGDARAVGAEFGANICILMEISSFVKRIEEILNVYTAEELRKRHEANNKK